MSNNRQMGQWVPGSGRKIDGDDRSGNPSSQRVCEGKPGACKNAGLTNRHNMSSIVMPQRLAVCTSEQSATKSRSKLALFAST
jgi:hypothetical protein